jgi:hypothetical protein
MTMRVALTLFSAAALAYLILQVVPIAVAWAGPSTKCCL